MGESLGEGWGVPRPREGEGVRRTGRGGGVEAKFSFPPSTEAVRKPRISVNCESFSSNRDVSAGAKLPFLL